MVPFFSPLNALVGAIAHPTFLEESHFEKISRTFDPPALFHRDGLTTPPQVPSYYPARVSADQGFAFHTGTVELTLPPSPVRATEVDFSFPLEARRRAEDILVRNKSTYFIQVFSGVAHGFAVRCDLNIPHERASLSRVWYLVLDANLLFVYLFLSFSWVGVGQVGQRKKVHAGSRSGSSSFRRDAIV